MTDEQQPAASREELEAAVASLIDRSEIEQIRLLASRFQAAPNLPDQVGVEIRLIDVSAAGSEGDDSNPGNLTVAFTHMARMTDGDEMVAEIEFTHSAQVRFTGERPDDHTMSAFVMSHVFFMTYPYVRQTLQEICMQAGLPPIVLGYLRRGESVPRNITLVVNKTDLAVPTSG